MASEAASSIATMQREQQNTAQDDRSRRNGKHSGHDVDLQASTKSEQLRAVLATCRALLAYTSFFFPIASMHHMHPRNAIR